MALLWAGNPHIGPWPSTKGVVASRRTHEGRFDASRGHQRQIAIELDCIAKAVIVEHQHALASASGPLPGLKAHPERLTERLSRKPARLVAVKPLFEVPERQHEAAL